MTADADREFLRQFSDDPEALRREYPGRSAIGVAGFCIAERTARRVTFDYLVAIYAANASEDAGTAAVTRAVREMHEWCGSLTCDDPNFVEWARRIVDRAAERVALVARGDWQTGTIQ